MIKLNLLPLEEKKILQIEKTFSCVFSYCFKGCLVLLIFIFLLVGTWVFQKIQMRNIEKDLSKMEGKNELLKIKFFEEEINNANKNIERLNGIQQKTIAHSKVLEGLSLITPDNVQISGFAYDSSTQKGSIDGYAMEREGFIVFKNAMEKNPFFSEIDSPMSNLVKSTDNNFRISFTLKK